VGPDHTMRGEPEAGAKQLPRRPRFVIRSPAQSLFMAGEPLIELARQSRERPAIGAVRPQHVAARPATPGGDVPAANGRARSDTFAIEKKEIVSARLHAQLRRPAIADGEELRTQPPADPLRTRRQDPGTGAL